jgi:CysZ protein
LIPVGLTLLLYGWGFFALQRLAAESVSHLLQSWGWTSWIITMIEWLSRIMVVLAGALTFTFASTLISSPFNDFLAEAAEPFGTPPLPPVPSQGLTYKIRLLWLDLVKTGASLVLSLAALVITWVPLLNIVGFVLVFLVMAFQYVSYPQTRRGLTLFQSLPFLRKNFFACVGFGAVVSILFSIPFLSVLALPVAVVSGTLLVAGAQPRPSPGQ